MAYTDSATLTDYLSDRELIELTDDERLAVSSSTIADAITANAAIGTRVSRAITNAETTVNAWARKQIEPPIKLDSALPSTVANTPDTVVMLASQLAIVWLFMRRAGEFTELPATVQAMKADAMAMLKGINNGSIDLGEAAPPPKSSLVVSVAEGEDRLFTADTLKDF